MHREPRLIAVDWGTTNFRAYLIDGTGSIIADVQSGEGILSVKGGQFGDVLRARVGPWIEQHGRLPVMMSGMIGSRQGWVEVPYVHCPARISDLASGLQSIEVEGLASVHIVPGLDHIAPDGTPDVMRGEETQILGALALELRQEGLFVLPGTHSKWANVTDGAIISFTTYMTGEIFAALKHHTILGRLMKDANVAGRGFTRGIEVAREHRAQPGALLHDLFSVRTLGLFGLLHDYELPEYLSGLLIGCEVAAAAVPGQLATIIGSEELVLRYGRAAGMLGLEWKSGPRDCLVAGQVIIARAAGLIRVE